MDSREFLFFLYLLLFLCTSLYSVYSDNAFGQLSHMLVVLLQRVGSNKDGQPDSTVE